MRSCIIQELKKKFCVFSLGACAYWGWSDYNLPMESAGACLITRSRVLSILAPSFHTAWWCTVIFPTATFQYEPLVLNNCPQVHVHGWWKTMTAGYQPHSPGPQSTLWLLQILLFSPICHMVLPHQADISFLDNTQSSCLACLTSILATSSQELISPQYFFHKRHPLHPP